jgi:hypothetical protein
MKRAFLLIPVLLTACRPTCLDCADPQFVLALLGDSPGAKGALPEGQYDVAVATDRNADSCSFTLTPTGCPGGEPNCVVDSTCTDNYSSNLDFGEVVPVFDAGMSWPALEISDRDASATVTVAIDGVERAQETLALEWTRQRIEPGPYELPHPTCYCDLLVTEPYVVVGD